MKFTGEKERGKMNEKERKEKRKKTEEKEMRKECGYMTLSELYYFEVPWRRSNVSFYSIYDSHKISSLEKLYFLRN